ncbi:hypothetical protein V5799_021855 [Amblyomma americanum]|uniref:SP-RING-type domain-containing protein n=1 Tax=Amblyomma americanum TaxID=6943 RepID=A0AAQ4FM90_AMBAM
MSVNGVVHYGLPLTMVDITPLLTPPDVNWFTLGAEVFPAKVTVSVHKVAKVSECELLRSTDVSSYYVHTQEDAEAILRSRSARSEDVVVKDLMVSLLCPLTKTKIRVPGRGIRCRHLQCFDVYSYLDVNECTLYPSWRCPVCRDLVLVQDIRLDLFTLDILNKVHCQCDTVVLQGNGSWQPVTSQNVAFADKCDVDAEEARRDASDSLVIDLTAESDED